MKIKKTIEFDIDDLLNNNDIYEILDYIVCVDNSGQFIEYMINKYNTKSDFVISAVEYEKNTSIVADGDWGELCTKNKLLEDMILALTIEKDGLHEIVGANRFDKVTKPEYGWGYVYVNPSEKDIKC